MWEHHRLFKQNSKNRKKLDLTNDRSVLESTIIKESKLAADLDKLLSKAMKYQPITELIQMKQLKTSPYLQIKKYKDSLYYGDIKYNKKNGKGIMLYSNNRLYEGDWQDNYKDGKGYEKFTNGSVYQGDYSKGKPQGCGKYQWQNGETYEGQWQNGIKNGSGIWRGSKGDSYIGEWKDGKADGYGVHTWINGDRYEGQFKNCLKHGEGIEKFANGDTYKGLYENGKPSGTGEYFWAIGSHFKGEFKNGLRHGKGVWRQKSINSDCYEGQYFNDKKQGNGMFTWADGSTYTGSYVNDLRQGYGEMFWTDGRVYKGEWKEGAQINDNKTDNLISCIFPFDQTEQNYQVQPQINNNNIIVTTNGLGFENNNTFDNFQYNQPKRPMMADRKFRSRTSKNSIRIQSCKTANLINNFIFESPYQKVRPQKKYISRCKFDNNNSFKRTDNIQNEKQSMSSTFFYHKTYLKNNNNLKGRAQSSQKYRQVRTSGGKRNKHIQQEYKYFLNSKAHSYSNPQFI